MSDALGLVGECIDGEHPLVVRKQLAFQVEKLLREGTSRSLISEALREWDQRPDAPASWLPYLISDAIRRRRIIQRQAEGMKAYADWEDKLKQEMNG